MRTRYSSIALFLSLVVVVAADAGLTVSYTFAQLMERADLVVVAIPLETRETSERTELPDIWTSLPDGAKAPIRVGGVETVFKCLLVFKGACPPDSVLTLHHYRELEKRAVVMSGPILLTFDPGVKRGFLMFLMREQDGRYAPAGGQTDPGSNGIRALTGISR